MIADRSRSAIALPRWFAGCDTSGGAQPPVPEGLVRVGPFVIGRPDEGCELCLFGPPSNQSVALFDGFLFERLALTKELGLQADARPVDLVAAAYERWGNELFNHLAGHYLVAVWDGRVRRLLVGHDPLGRHPVFYARSNSTFWFSSNVLALAESGVVPRRPNRLSLLFAAVTLWPEAGQTFFDAISRLRAGHHLLVDANGVRECKHWDPLPGGPDEWLSEREVLEQFEPSLERAVSRCMSLMPDGIMLSGGVDSVTIAALATTYRRSHGQPALVAFSGRPNVPILEEEHMQTRAADALGLPHIVKRTSDWTGRRNSIEMSLARTPDLPTPSRIYWVGAYMAFYRMAADNNLHVLLTGSGGDNWLSVADVHAADLIRAGRFIQLARFAKASARTGGGSYPYAFRDLFWRGGVKALLDSAGARLLPERKRQVHRARALALMPEWLCPDATLREEFLDRWLDRRPPALDKGGRFPANYYHHSLTAVSNPHLYYEFEVAFHVDAMCGLRLLSPYHDAEVVRFFNRIPPPLLVRGNKYKGLLRPIVDKHLPGLGFGEQRKDYPQRVTDADLEDLREGVMRAWPTFSFKTLQGLGVVTTDLSTTEAGRAPHYGNSALVRMFALMSAELWTSRHTT